MFEPIVVTADHPRVPTAVPLGRIMLLEHQTHMVQAMLDREQTYFDFLAGRLPPQAIFLEGGGRPRRCHKRTQRNEDGLVQGTLSSNACVLADRPGTGKTYEILALISHRPFPGMANEPLAFRGVREMRGISYTNGSGLHECWRLQYNCVHRTNLIFVGKTVLRYWQETIERDTDLRVLVVEGVKDLRNLYQYVFVGAGDDLENAEGEGPGKSAEASKKGGKSGSKAVGKLDTRGASIARYTTAAGETRYVRRLDRWDIILVKNGAVSGSMDIPELEGTRMENTKTKNIVGLFGLLFRNHCFGRVILDDYDTLGIVSSSQVIPSMFTWYVSATRPSRTTGSDRPTPQTLWDQLRLVRPLYNDINGMREDFIGKVRVSCCSSLLDRSLRIASVSHWLYTLENPHDRLIGAMTDLQQEDLAEMLNADALCAAAAASNTQDISVAGIFQHLLQSRYEQYCRLNRNLKYAEGLESRLEGALDEDDRERTRSFPPAEAKVRRNMDNAGPLAKLRRLYGRMGPDGRDEMRAFIAGRRREMREEVDKLGASIRRVRENITEGECPIMLTPLAETARVYILRCCSVVISEEAAQGLSREHLRGYSRLTCPKCRACLTENDAICVPQLRLTDILEETPWDPEPAAKEEVPSVEDAPEETAKDTPEGACPKVRTIVEILRGTQPEAGNALAERRKVSNPLPGLLEGGHSLGEASEGERKFLVFANHEEMLSQICKHLNTEGIGYRTLRGTTAQLEEIIARYKLPNADPRSYRVLLVNGLQYCAGMNLQCTTDLIFTHWVTRRNVACQIGGRAARHGRERDLQLHYVLYRNEEEAFAAAT